MKKELTSEERAAFLKTLKNRFDKNMHRHKTIDWTKVQARIESDPQRAWCLHEMEKTDGEPDVIGVDKKTGKYIFYDCAPESPKGRRSFCYDGEALKARKENKPKNSVMEMAAAMGIEILTEEEYQELQTYGHFDAKTSSWLKTPDEIRKLGGAIFGDYRYGRVFIAHNGADSYYAVRGFRGSLRI